MSTVQKHNAPALRFKDESGREYPDWENHSLDKIATVTMGTSPASTAYNQNGVGLPLIQGNADIKNRKSIPRVYTSIITKECLPNDTLLSVRAPVGEVSRSDHHACIGRGIASIRVREAAVRQIFLYNYLVWHEPKWRSISQGSTFEAVNSNDIRSLRVKIPSKSEQQKITAFLSAVDTKIEQLDRKKSLLEQYKKGMMQKLFSREIRFKDEDGRDYPDWAEKELGDISEVLMCKRIFASQTNPNGGVPFYKIGTLGGEPDAFISKDLFEEYKSKYNFPRPGEILITCSGTVGKCLAYDGSDAYFQDSNIVWIDNPTLEVSNEFLLRILSNVNWSKLNSTTITRIYSPDLRGMAIKFPQNEQEQKRIADFLSAIDRKIELVAGQIEQARSFKQGLLQQMFI